MQKYFLSDDENWVEKCFLLPWLDLEKKRKRVTTFRRNGSKYAKNSFVSVDWVITSKDGHTPTPLIRTLSFSVKLLYIDGSIYIIHTMEILY